MAQAHGQDLLAQMAEQLKGQIRLARTGWTNLQLQDGRMMHGKRNSDSARTWAGVACSPDFTVVQAGAISHQRGIEFHAANYYMNHVS